MSKKPTKKPTKAADPKKAAQKAPTASKKAEPTTEPSPACGELSATTSRNGEAVSPTASKKKAPKKKKPVDGVALARLRRLVRWGCPEDRCALLGIALDVGPRASKFQRPLFYDDRWLSALGADILEAKVPPEALELAALRLGEKSE